MQDALASLLLPRSSVYAELDNPETSDHPTRTEQHQHSDPGQSHYALAASSFPEAEDDNPHNPSTADDPFAVSPSVASTRHPFPSPRQTGLGATLHSAPAAHQPAHNLADSRSPFQDEPLDSIVLHPPSPGPNSGSGPVSPQRSPPSSRRGRRVTGGSGLSASGLTAVGSSAIGDRSLMGLLGGTRYQPMGFEHDLAEEDHEEGHEGDSLMSSHHNTSKASARKDNHNR